MTSHQAQLQALITEIEALLNKAAPRLPWAMSGEGNQQRQVMTAVLDYLRELEASGALGPDWGSLAETTAIAPVSEPAEAITPAGEAVSHQVLQALLQEMQYLRTQMVRPLTAEVMALQQQRESLKHEVQQLELERMRRAEDGPPSSLNAAWMNQLVDEVRSSLLAHLTPQLQALQAHLQEPLALYGNVQDPQEVAASLPLLSPQQRLEQLQQIQAQTDYLILKLDANLRAVFDSLDQSIQSYCDTLNQGLDAMHSLGQQGEVMFRVLINHLAQQLKQESDYLAASEDDTARLRGDVAASLNVVDLPEPAADYRVADQGLAAEVDLDEVDLGDIDIDLDMDLDVDEEVTLFQLDEELTQLPLEDEVELTDEELDDWEEVPGDTFFQDEEQTILQTEPIPWEVAIGQMRSGSSLDEAPEVAAIAAESPDAEVPYTEEIDALYESLFGESEETDETLILLESGAGDAGSEVGEPESESGPLFPIAVPESAPPDPSVTDQAVLAETLLALDRQDFAWDPLGAAADQSPPEAATTTPEPPFPPAIAALDPSLAALFESPPEMEDEGFPAAGVTAAETEPDTPSSLEYLLGSEVAAELVAAEEDAVLDSDTISSLAELLPSSDLSTARRPVDPFAALDESEDAFIPAPPDEDLLAADTEAVVTKVDLSLDDETLGQLTADLSQLEGLPFDDLDLSPQLTLTDDMPNPMPPFQGPDWEPPAAAAAAAFPVLEPTSEPAAALSFDEALPSPETAGLSFADLFTDAAVPPSDLAPSAATPEAAADPSELSLPVDAGAAPDWGEPALTDQWSDELADRRPRSPAPIPPEMDESLLADSFEEIPDLGVETPNAMVEATLWETIDLSPAAPATERSDDAMSEPPADDPFTWEDAFGPDIDALAGSLADHPVGDEAGDDLEVSLETAAPIQPEAVPPAATDLTAETFDLSVTPLSDGELLDPVPPDPSPTLPPPAPIAPLDEDIALTLEEMVLEFDLPTGLSEAERGDQHAVEVDPESSDDLAELTIEALAPEAEDVISPEFAPEALDEPPSGSAIAATSSPSDPEAETALTFEDLALSLEGVSLDLDLPDTAEPSSPMLNEEVMTLESLMDHLETSELPEEIPPVPTDTPLEEWADTFGAANATVAAEESLSLGDLEMDLSLDLEPEALDFSGTRDLGDLYEAMTAPSPTDPGGEAAGTFPLAPGETEAGLPDSASLPIAGSTATGFAIAVETAALDQLLDALLSEIPPYEGDFQSVEASAMTAQAADPQAAGLEAPDRPRFDITGSPETGFRLLTSETVPALEQAIADLPIAAPFLAATATSPAAPLLGFPEPQSPPETAAPLPAPPPLLELVGTVETGFALGVDDPALSAELAQALAAVPEAAALPASLEPEPDVPSVPSDPSERLGFPGTLTAADQAAMVSAGALPFAIGLTAWALPELAESRADVSAVPTTPRLPDTAIPVRGDGAEPGLPLGGSLAEGYEIQLGTTAASLADEVLASFPENDQPLRIPEGDSTAAAPDGAASLLDMGLPTLPLRGGYDLGFETAEDLATLETLGQTLSEVPAAGEAAGVGGDRSLEPPDLGTQIEEWEQAIPEEPPLPTLDLVGSYETGFSLQEDAGPLVDDLADWLTDPWERDEAAAEPAETSQMPPFEALLGADFNPLPVTGVDSQEARPLSDDELADLFPPQVNPVEALAVSPAADSLDELFQEAEAEVSPVEAAVEDAALAFPDGETDASIRADETDDISLASLDGLFQDSETEVSPFEAAVEDAAIAFLDSEADAPIIAAAGDNISLLGDDFTAAGEADEAASLLSESEFADLFPPTVEVAAEADPGAPGADQLPGESVPPPPEPEPALEIFETPADDLDLADLFTDAPPLSAEAAADTSQDWDPLEADFPLTELDLLPILGAEETDSAPRVDGTHFDRLDLAMDDIPAVEIADDEAFRAAFQEDFLAVPEDFSPPEDADLTSVEVPGRLEEPFGELTASADDSLTFEPSADIDPDEGQPDLLELEPLAREATPSSPAAAPTAPAAVEPVTPAVPIDASAHLAIVSTATRGEEPPVEAPTATPEMAWFLGIDLGTNGLSAVLMNAVTGSAHPLYWADPAATIDRDPNTFRIPAVATFVPSAPAHTSNWELQAVGMAAIAGYPEAPHLCLVDTLKPMLKAGVSHTTADGTWEPVLQWSDTQMFPLQQVLAAVSALLAQVKYSEDIEMAAVGMELPDLHDILDNLQGVMVGHPTHWPDTYRLNMREAILASGLVDDPNQIFFVEEAIAAILSGLPDPHEPPPDSSQQVQTLYQCDWQGGTVVISSGASCTEVGLANLPRPLDTLSREDFVLRQMAYGGDALDLDIICQLLIPPERRQPLAPGDRRSARKGWGWQPTLPGVTDAQWESLHLEAMDLPQLAEPDVSARVELRQHLQSTPLGQSLLEAARHLKLTLQTQNQFQLDLADQSWRVLRRDLESRVLVPYIQRLNQHLNALLSQTGLSAQGINQVICTGGNASFGTIAKWLRQKFPNATIIQDTYPTNRPLSCSRVAYGLVNLSRYPQMLDVPRHQYSDYFLLHEIVRLVPETPLPLSGILHLLEEQGINTEVCRSRIEAILMGHLPPGLVPDASTRPVLARPTLESEVVQGLAAGPLFTQQTRDIYMLNGQQRDRLRQHLAMLMAHKRQTLAEPMIAQLVML